MKNIDNFESITLETPNFTTSKKIIKILILCLFFIFNSEIAKAENGLENQPTSSEISDEQAHLIMLTTTPAEVREMLKNSSDVDRIFLCNTLLNTAIKSMVKGPNAQFPDYAIEKVKILIEVGADVNKVGCKGVLPPLGWAAILPVQFVEAEHDENKALEELIETKTEYCNLSGIISKPCKDITPTELKSIKNNIHQIYLEARKEYNPLFLNMLKLLIKNGADIHQKDFAGQTPLHRAALTPKGETLELMKYLIAEGANVNAKDSEGNTPLFIAQAVKNDDAVNLLINSGADTTIKNNLGVTYKYIRGARKRDVYKEEGVVETINDDFN